MGFDDYAAFRTHAHIHAIAWPNAGGLATAFGSVTWPFTVTVVVIPDSVILMLE